MILDKQANYFLTLQGGIALLNPVNWIENNIVSLALAYHIEQNPIYLTRVRTILWQGIPPYVGMLFQGTCDSTNYWNKAHQVIGLSLVYDLLYNEFSDSERTDIKTAIRAKIFDCGLRYYDYSHWADYGNNQWALRASAMGLATLALYGDEIYPEAAADLNYVRTKMLTAPNSLMKRYFHDGAGVEGIYYGFATLMSTLSFMHAVGRWDGIDYFRDPAIEAALRALPDELAYEVSPAPRLGWNRYFNNFSDSHGNFINSSGFFAPLLTLIGKYQSGIGQWVFDNTVQTITNMLTTSDVEWFKRGGAEAFFMSFLTYDGLPSVEPSSVLPKSRHFLDRGLVYVRTSSPWADENDIQFAIEGHQVVAPTTGFYNATDHTHSDKNHFTLYAYGKDFIVDEGYFERVNSSAHHNYILIDNRGQANNPAFNPPRGTISGHVSSGGLKLVSSAAVDFVHGDAKEAFNYLYVPGHLCSPIPPQQYCKKDETDPVYGQFVNTVQNADRFVHFVKVGNGIPPYIIMADDIQRDTNARDYTWRFHSNENVTNCGQNPIIIQGYSSPNHRLYIYHDDNPQQYITTGACREITASDPPEDPLALSLPPSTFTQCDIVRQDVVNPYFHIVLYPYKPGLPSAPVWSNLSATNGSILEIAWQGGLPYKDYSIFRHTGTVTSALATTDARLTFVRSYQGQGSPGTPVVFSMSHGTKFSFDGTLLVNLYGQEGTVMKQGTEVLLFGDITCFRVYAPNATSVKLNDDEVPFVQDGDYVDGLLAFAEENKSCTSSATWSNSSRHIAQQNGRLHQLFSSAGDIIYRRQDISTAQWDITKRISSPSMNNQHHASVVVDHNGIVHAVWQRQPEQGVNTFQLWYAQGADNGETWSEPVILPHCSSIDASSTQLSIYPVIAECAGEKLVVVFCSNDGLMYTISEDGGESWLEDPFGIASQSNPNSYVWYPSLVSISNYLMLTYDYRYYGVWSRMFDGSAWSGEENVNDATGGIFDRHSSVSGNGYGGALAAWCAQRIVGGQLDPDYHIYLREQNPDGKWDWFTEFIWGARGVSDMYPSVSSMSWGHNVWKPVVIHQNNYNQILYKQYNPSYAGWDDCLMSSSGLWANVSHSEDAGTLPVAVWTNQSSNPHLLELYGGPCGEMNKVTVGRNTVQKRRVVIQDRRNRSSLLVEMDPILVVTLTGDTVQLPFKSRQFGQRTDVDLTTVWDYLGSETIILPSNSTKLLLGVRIEAIASRDTSGTEGTNSFSSRSFSVHLLRGTSRIPLWSNASGTSAMVEIDVRQFAGQSVGIKPVGTIPPGLHQYLSVSAGDVVIGRSTENRPSLQKAQGSLPSQFRLGEVYPNPFNPSTTITFDLPEPSNVSIIIYDMLGRRVAELVNDSHAAGYHSVQWNGVNAASGVYFVRFIATNGNGSVMFSKINKAVLMK